MEWISVGGLRLRVLIRGEGLPVLFLHGFGGRIESFLPVIEEVARDCQVIALDLPGFGMSDAPAPLQPLLSAEQEGRELLGGSFEYEKKESKPTDENFEDGEKKRKPTDGNFEDERKVCKSTCGNSEYGKGRREAYAFGTGEYAQVLALLLDALKVRCVGVVAHSFGGRVALDFAAHYPERVLGMILCDSAGVRPKRSLRYYCRVFCYKLGKKLGIRPKIVGSEDYRNLSPAMRATFVKTVNQDCRGYLHRIDCPVLLIWGENDLDTPLYMARVLKNGIRDCELIVFSDCGHFAYLDQTYRFNCIVRSFFSRS